MVLLCKFPIRGRKDKFFATLDRYYATLSGKHIVKFLITIDEDDDTYALSDFNSYKNLSVFFCEPKGKINACNAGMEDSGAWDIVILASDDQIPVEQGWDDIIAKDMQECSPDFDGVVQYNDGFIGERINTQCIMGRVYYNRFGYIYHHSYESLWCDNEFTDVSVSLNKVKYFDRCIIRHNHPQNIKSVSDDLYIRNYESWFRDKANYQSRKLMGFPK